MRSLLLINMLLMIKLFSQNDYLINGELKQWHGIKITFSGPMASEESEINPFTDYRLNVRFTHADTSYLVPGYYAADGNASETGAVSGNKWRVIFTPERTGEWTFKVSFRRGEFIAVDTALLAGEVDSFDGMSGNLFITESNKTSTDFRSQGMLGYYGKRYLQFSGSGKYFIKGGTNSPENFLAYHEFDQTPSSHKFKAHINDWKVSDPTWQNNKGRGIIGAVNYLSSKGVNSVYMLTFNVNGDGKDVWPFINRSDWLRFDCSKLDQWDIVFTHMQSKGILCHFVTQETENDHDLDNGNLGNERKLYYRELIARFGYHPAIIWNLGEEITNSTSQIKSFAEYIRNIDPYNHPITMHNINFNNFSPLIGLPYLDGPSMYIYDIEDVNEDTKMFINASENSGRAWVCFLDEIGPYDEATPPDNIDFWHDDLRKNVIWGHLMGGGAGLEWYIGYEQPHNDLTMEDFRTRDNLWSLTANAVNFFNTYLPYADMSANDLLVNPGNHCISEDNEIYAVYLPNGGSAYIYLPDTGSYHVKWYNPRIGGTLQDGSKTLMTGSGRQFIGLPPYEVNLDWAAIISKNSPGKSLPELSLLVPYSLVLNDSAQKFDIRVRILDAKGNLSTSADPVNFIINGPGILYGNNSVTPVNGYAEITFIPSVDTGTTYIRAVHQGILSDSISIRTVMQLGLDDFEEYVSTMDLAQEWKSPAGIEVPIELENIEPISGRNSLRINYNFETEQVILLEKEFNRSFEGAKYLSFWLQTDISDLQITVFLTGESRKWYYNLLPSAPTEYFYIIPLDSFKVINDTAVFPVSDIKSLQLQLAGKVYLPPGRVVFDSFEFSTTEDIYTEVDSENPKYHLLQNYPNPFNRTTNIRYNLSQPVEINISVYDILGNLVAVIYEGTQSAGEHSLPWNAENVTSGIYLIRLKTGEYTKSIKSILLK